MSRLLLILRWIGAFVVAWIVFLTVIAVGISMIRPDFGTVFAHVFEILYFLAIFLAVALGVLVVPREQRKVAALVLWILAVAYSVWPLMTGHLGPSNFLLLSEGVVGGGIVYYLARTDLFSGGKINRTSSQNS